MEKCELLHFNKLNRGRTYSIIGRALGSGVTEQRESEVQIYSFLKVATRVNRVVKDPFGVLAFIDQGTDL